MAISLSLRDELYVDVDTAVVEEKVIHFFTFMRPNYKHAITVSEPTEWLVGSPSGCLLFEGFHAVAGNHSGKEQAHGHSVGLFTELPIETEKQYMTQ